MAKTNVPDYAGSPEKRGCVLLENSHYLYKVLICLLILQHCGSISDKEAECVVRVNIYYLTFS